jgi:hypothetical protein
MSFAAPSCCDPTFAAKPFRIAIMTPTLSSSEDEFRAGQNMAKKYPDIVKHITHPDNFNAEIETTISQIVSLADDPQMKAIVIASGGSGFLPAIQKVKEKRPDILFITAPIWDDPVLMSKHIDLCLDTDWIRRGETIVRKAQKMGAKTFIHYSFPTHLAKEAISMRKSMMEKTCAELGMTSWRSSRRTRRPVTAWRPCSSSCGRTCPDRSPSTARTRTSSAPTAPCTT